MEWKRGCSLVLAVVLVLNAVQWPAMKGWAAEPGREAGTVTEVHAARATQSEAEQAAGENEAERERPGGGEMSGEERPGGGTVGGETAGGEKPGGETTGGGTAGGEMPGNGTPGEAELYAPDMEAEGISRFFVRNPRANTGGKLEVDGRITVLLLYKNWVINQIYRFYEKYNKKVIEEEGMWAKICDYR